MKRKRKDKSNKKRKKRKIYLKNRSDDHKKSIEKAKNKNKIRNQRGRVRCNKLPFRYSKGPKTWPNIDGFKNLNVCSGSNQIYKELSPMKLGPINVKVVTFNKKIKTIEAKNLENLWQASKVWSGDLINTTFMKNKKRNWPCKRWFSDRNKYFRDSKAHRHIKKGTGKNVNISLYSLWVDQKTNEIKKLSYLEGRREIYCPIYKQLAKETNAYKKIESLLNDGYNIQILGYDGYDYEEMGKTLEECYADDSRPFGHELCLVAMLQNKNLF